MAFADVNLGASDLTGSPQHRAFVSNGITSIHDQTDVDHGKRLVDGWFFRALTRWVVLFNLKTKLVAVADAESKGGG